MPDAIAQALAILIYVLAGSVALFVVVLIAAFLIGMAKAATKRNK